MTAPTPIATLDLGAPPRASLPNRTRGEHWAMTARRAKGADIEAPEAKP